MDKVQFEKSVNSKIAEAEFFYSQLKDAEIQEDKEKFTYYVSAFTSSTRSVLQYCLEFDKVRDSAVSVYNRLLANVTLKQKFKDIRDTNIHRQSLVTTGVSTDSILIELEVVSNNGEQIVNENIIEENEDCTKYYFVGDDYFDEALTIENQSREYLKQIRDFVNQFFLTL